MLKYLPYAIQGVAIIAGVAGGLFLKSMGSGAAEEEPAHEEASAHEEAPAHAETSAIAGGKDKKAAHKKDAQKKKEKKDSGHGGGHGEESADGASGYMKFSRQFVVPVIGEAGVASLVVLDINIEVPPSEAERVYLQEPKLRDSLLATLLALSNNGAFSNQLLEQGNLDAMRARLLESARSIIGDSALNVLILNITRQDV